MKFRAHVARRKAQSASYVKEFDHVQPTFSSLVLRDERLRPAKLPGDRGLRQGLGLARLDQQPAKFFIPVGKDGLGQSRLPMGNENGKPLAGLTQNGIRAGE